MDNTKYYFKYKSLKRKFDDFADRITNCNFGVNLRDDDYDTEEWCQNYAKRHCDGCHRGFCNDHLPCSCEECEDLDNNDFCDDCHNYNYHPIIKCPICKTSRQKYKICESCGWMCCEFNGCSRKNICGDCFNECTSCRNFTNKINILFDCQIRKIVKELLINKLDQYQILIINSYL